MRLPLALSAAALIAIAAAACSGGQSTNYVAPPAGSGSTPVVGPVALSQTATVESAGTANGVTGSLTFGSGTGTVTSVASSIAPAGTVAVVPADVKRVIEATSATSPNVYYVTITSTTGATLSGLPAVALSLSQATIGTYQEAQWTGTKFANVAGATAAVAANGMAVSFPAGTKTVTIPANGSIYLAFYQGNYPNATPPGGLANNILADSDFESGTAGAIGTAVNSTGWTQCTVNKAAPGVAAPARAFSSYTPSPGSTPAAIIATQGATIKMGTASPPPTTTTVQVVSGTHAALFGGQFTTYDPEDYRYNGLCQTVTMPANPQMNINLWAFGNDGTSYADFEIMALNSSGQYLGSIYEDKNPITSTVGGDTGYRLVSVPESSLSVFAGQTIELFIGMWIDGGNTTYYGTAYLVDGVALGGS